jgi:hypothetical protein
MSILLRSSAVAVATSLTAALLAAPGAAFAAGTVTTLSATQMAAALKTVATTSQAASAHGWRSTTAISATTLSASEVMVVDPGHGVARDQFRVGTISVTTYIAEHKGTYEQLIDPVQRSAVKMMKKPGARYEFMADKKLTLAAYLAGNGTSPADVLSDDVSHAGTRTVNDDGSTDFAFTADDDTAATIHVDADGVLTSADATATDLTATLTFGYGPQTVTLPTASATVSSAELNRGVAYLQMAANVKAAAADTATATRKAAHGHTVKVSALRKAARHSAADFNKAVQVTIIKVKDIGGGAKLYATNPWTHTTVAYAVKAAGKKVTVKKK